MRFRSILTLILALFALSTVATDAFAQTPTTSGSRLAWDQPAASLAEASGFTYKYYRDAAPLGVTLTPVTCADGTVANVFICDALFPPDTPGVPHTVALTASNVAGESLKSTPLAYQFFVVPADPRNLRVR